METVGGDTGFQDNRLRRASTSGVWALIVPEVAIMSHIISPPKHYKPYKP